MPRRTQLSMMDFTQNKRTHNTETDNNEPLPKKSTPDDNSSSSTSIKSKSNDGTWFGTIESSLLVYTMHDVESREKIAGFDMDGTLITTKSGNTFPKDTNDWKLWNAKVPAKLQQLHADGYKIVIFTNQRGIEKGKVRVSDFKNKIVNVSKALQVPLQAFVSTGPVHHRKPYIGMWTELENHYNDNVAIDRSKSIYCGDAAGRLKTATRKADHSNADRSFAFNLGVTFKTPEQLFLGQTNEEPYKQPSFNPRQYLSITKSQFVPSTTKFPYDSSKKELIVMVGPPASGKSYISKILSEKYGYAVVNQDTLGTKNACHGMVQKLLKEGKNIIVDNTNRDPQTRDYYLQAAKRCNYRCRAITMECEQSMASHNNIYREIVGTDVKHKGIGTMVFRMYYSAFSEPTHEEGFDDLIHCNFVPEFSDEKAKQIYHYILNES